VGLSLQSRSVQWAIALLLASVTAVAGLAPIDALFGVVFAALALWLAKSDLKSFELPDLGNALLAVLGATWIATLAEPVVGLQHAALRAFAAAACLSAVKWSYARLRGFEGLGWGDVKLAAAGAIWLDWPQLPVALFIAAVAGILAVAVRSTLAEGRLSTSIAIPFGAFLAPSAWLVWFAGRANLL
jgi:prepilin signal peptidase PulO-like enzyme (type II secretory pathway)